MSRDEVAVLIDNKIAAAMAQHNRNATIISMILGCICLALFLDGLLRILGIIPPFMGLDVNVIDDIVDPIMDSVKSLPIPDNLIPDLAFLKNLTATTGK